MSAVNDRADICWQLYRKAQQYREKTKDGIWQQVAEYCWGDQNIRRTTEGEQNDYVYNLVHKHLKSKSALLCRGIPTYDIAPWYQTALPQKQTLEDKVNATWGTNDPGVRIVELIQQNGLPFGSAYLKITWDPSMMMGLGGIRIQVPDTRNIYFMPGVSRVRDSLVMFERRYVDKLTALSLYPDQANAINELFSLSSPSQNQSGSISPSGPPIHINVEGTVSQTYLNQTASMNSEKGQIELV